MSLWRADIFFIVLTLVVMYAPAGQSDYEAAQVTEEIAQEADRKCAVSVAQYGPTERWKPGPKEPVCVNAAYVLPAHLLTYPIGDRK